MTRTSGGGRPNPERVRGTIGLLVLAVVLLWGTWRIDPLKILVFFFHELSHGLAATLTGGSIVEI